MWQLFHSLPGVLEKPDKASYMPSESLKWNPPEEKKIPFYTLSLPTSRLIPHMHFHLLDLIFDVFNILDEKYP